MPPSSFTRSVSSSSPCFRNSIRVVATFPWRSRSRASHMRLPLLWWGGGRIASVRGKSYFWEVLFSPQCLFSPSHCPPAFGDYICSLFCLGSRGAERLRSHITKLFQTGSTSAGG